MQPNRFRPILALLALIVILPGSLLASSHREAPITALDRTADITDWYAFVSFDHPDRVTMILNVDPFLEPSNGPNYFPFDPTTGGPGYVWHCHILDHEDNEMMRPLVIAK